MLIPIIVSGGAGTRLWPVSRQACPKPFMKLGGGASLLQRTLERCLPLADAGSVAVVTHRDYEFQTREELAPVLAGHTVQCTQLLEPIGRNTAPAIAMAALWAEQRSPGATLLILPADHLIPDSDAFRAAAREAAALADTGALVLFGITPTAPETGFGYIETAAPSDDGPGRRVLRFIEKPDAECAMSFLESGRYLWNSGMFCFRADALLAALAEHAPDILVQARATWHATPAAEHDAIVLDTPTFAACREVSLDYAVMEHADHVMVLPASFGWSDIGSWKAVAAQFPPDAAGNTAEGDALFIDTHDTHVQSTDRLVAAVGLRDLVVVDTPDAVLVAHKDASQSVREVVTRLKARNHEAVRVHRTVARPWGTYTVLQEGPRFKIKRIEVKPGQSLSLQMHHHRSEHWIVVSGTARVTCDERTYLVAGNQSTYIPIGTRHRLENPGVLDLVMIEVQCGDYLGEDDIVRFADQYGRAAG